MAIAFVQKAIGTDNVSGTTAAVTIAAGGDGNLICGMVTCADAQTVSSVKDNNNVSATIVDTIDDTGNATRAVSFYFKNVSGSPTTITATFSASTTFARIEVNEWSGLDTVSPLDGHAGQTSSGTSLTTQNYTTTADGNLLYGAVVIDSAAGSTLTAGSGYTLRNDGSGAGSIVTMADESQIQSAHSSTTVATFGVNVTESAIVLGMAFKAAAAASFASVLARPAFLRTYKQAPFLNRFPPGAENQPPQRPDTVAGVLAQPAIFHPYANAPWLTRLPPTETGIPPQPAATVQGALAAPIRFDPYNLAPFLNRLPLALPPFVSGNVVSLPGFGSLIITGPPPSLAARIFPGFGSITLTGLAPILRTTVKPGFGSLVLTGQAPALAFVDHPGFASIVLTGFAPTVNQTSGQTVLPGLGQLTLTGPAPSLAETVFPGFGAITLTGRAPSLAVAAHPGFGQLALSGFAPITRPLAGVAGIHLSGFAPTVSQSGGGAAQSQQITSLGGILNPGSNAIG